MAKKSALIDQKLPLGLQEDVEKEDVELHVSFQIELPSSMSNHSKIMLTLWFGSDSDLEVTFTESSPSLPAARITFRFLYQLQ